MKRIAIAVPALAALAAAAAAVAALAGGYDRVAHVLIVAAGKAHQEEAFRAAYFTRITYAALIGAIALAALAAGAIAYVVAIRFDRIAAFATDRRRELSEATADTARRLAALAPLTKASLAALIGVQAIWFAVRAATLPVTYDEAWTFMNFTLRPFFASLTYYPAPNNHVLYSFLSNISDLLPGEPMFAMRLISVVFATLTTCTLCVVALRYWDESAVVIALALFAFAYPIAVYAVLARGYMMVVFFTAVCFGSVFAGVTASERPSLLALAAYAASGILGFYTIPLFLYPFASVNVCKYVYVLASRRDLRPWLVTDVLVALATVVVYTPIFLLNGVGAVTANPYVARSTLDVALTQLPSRLMTMGNWLLGVDGAGLAIVVVLVVVSAILRRRVGGARGWMERAMAVVALLPPVILVVHRTNPQQRTWIYVLVPLFFVTMGLVEAAILAARQRRLWTPWAVPVVVIAAAAASAQPFARHFGRDFVEDFQVESLFSGIPSETILRIAHDDIVLPYDEPLYFADMLAYRAQSRRRDPVRTERLTDGAATDADVVVVSIGGAARIPNLGNYALFRRNERLAVYVKK